MLLPPTRFDLPLLLAFLSLSLSADPTLCVYFLPISLQPFLYVAPLSLSLCRFPSTRSQPSSHHYSPSPLRFCHRSAMLSDSVLVLSGSEKGRSDARVAGGRLSALLLLRRSMYMALLQERRFFASLFFLLFFFQGLEGWHSSGTRIRNLPADNSRRLDRRPRLRLLKSKRAAIDISSAPQTSTLPFCKSF